MTKTKDYKNNGKSKQINKKNYLIKKKKINEKL